MRAFIDGRHNDGVVALIAQTTSATVSDPEMVFYVARHLAHVGEGDRAMPFITDAVETGYFCYPVMAEDVWLESVRARRIFSVCSRRYDRAGNMLPRRSCRRAARNFYGAG